MIEIIDRLKIIVTQFWFHAEIFLSPFLKNLDPSLFQNIILGILAIFIPFAIVFLTSLLDSKNERSEFEKMVLSDEVLGTKKVFWLSVTGIVFLAFFTGKYISTLNKVIAIVFSLILIRLFWIPFSKILKFSEGTKSEFEISFLKKLKLSNILRQRNKIKTVKMIKAWNSFWSEKSTYNEKGYTTIFISDIDEAMKLKMFTVVIELSKTYVASIEKRDIFSIGYDILPKILEWAEIFWNENQYWLKNYDYEKKIEKFLPQKYFPTFRKWGLNILQRIYRKADSFWNWNYFQQEFIPSVVKILLNDGHGPYEFFTYFKKHIDECEVKLEKIIDIDEKERYFNYIKGLFGSFCKSFFENINTAPYKFDVWEHYFPKEWKITMDNTKNHSPRILLDEFQKWASGRIFERRETGFDDKLSEVAGGLFPSVHSSLFPAFLILLYSSEIKYAIEKESNVFIIHGMLSWSGDISEDEINRMRENQERSQKEETIKIIYTYFWYWSQIKLYKEDLTAEENEKWKYYTEEQRNKILKKVRKMKLEKMKAELESNEIKKVCEESKEKESRRIRFLELINLLINGL